MTNGMQGVAWKFIYLEIVILPSIDGRDRQEIRGQGFSCRSGPQGAKE